MIFVIRLDIEAGNGYTRGHNRIRFVAVAACRRAAERWGKSGEKPAQSRYGIPIPD
jgi:hypothetical protein